MPKFSISADDLQKDPQDMGFEPADDTVQISPSDIQSLPAPQKKESMLTRAPALFGAGANRGMAGMAGMPVDVMTGGINAYLQGAGKNSLFSGILPEKIENPVGGSDWIQNHLLPKQPAPPQGFKENMIYAAGEQAPSLMIPAGEAAQGGNAARAAKVAVPSAAGSAVGTATARTLAPGNPYAEIAGAVLGGGVPAVVGAAASKIPNLDKAIDNNLRRIAPTTSKKLQGQSFGEIQNYNTATRNAVKSIVQLNREKPFTLTTSEGTEFKGLPKNRMQFAEAIDQAKVDVYRQYNAKAKASGEQGFIFNGNELTTQLAKYGTDENNIRRSASASNYALEIADRYKGKLIDPEEIEKDIALYNNKLKAHAKSNNPNDVSTAAVDLETVKNLRRLLDEGIERMNPGADYQAFKNKYGEIRTLQDTIASAAIKQLNDTHPLGWMQQDAFWLTEMTMGSSALALAGHPGAALGNAVSAATVMGLKRAIKRLYDPDVRLEGMFRQVDKHLPSETKFAGPGTYNRPMTASTQKQLPQPIIEGELVQDPKQLMAPNKQLPPGQGFIKRDRNPATSQTPPTAANAEQNLRTNRTLPSQADVRPPQDIGALRHHLLGLGHSEDQIDQMLREALEMEMKRRGMR